MKEHTAVSVSAIATALAVFTCAAFSFTSVTPCALAAGDEVSAEAKRDREAAANTIWPKYIPGEQPHINAKEPRFEDKTSRSVAQQTVTATRASKVPPINGSADAPYWQEAMKHQVTVPHGYLAAQNDADFVYLCLDLVGDQAPKSAVSDGCMLEVAVDANNDLKATTGVDLEFGCLQYAKTGKTQKLKQQMIYRPSASTGCYDTSGGLIATGIGASANLKATHRIWNVAIPIKDISTASPKSINFGLTVKNNEPNQSYAWPPTIGATYADLHKMVLSPER